MAIDEALANVRGASQTERITTVLRIVKCRQFIPSAFTVLAAETSGAGASPEWPPAAWRVIRHTVR